MAKNNNPNNPNHMRTELCHAVVNILEQWFPQFKFGTINHHFLWFSITGKYGADLSPLRELGIELNTERVDGDSCSWKFVLNEQVFNKIKDKYGKGKTCA